MSTQAQIINVDISQTVTERHICYYVDESRSTDFTAHLMQMVEAQYPHPDAPTTATISRIEIRDVGVFNKNTLAGKACVIGEASQAMFRSTIPSTTKI